MVLIGFLVHENPLCKPSFKHFVAYRYQPERSVERISPRWVINFDSKSLALSMTSSFFPFPLTSIFSFFFEFAFNVKQRKTSDMKSFSSH